MAREYLCSLLELGHKMWQSMLDSEGASHLRRKCYCLLLLIKGVSDSERKWIVLVWIQKQQQDSCHCFPPLVSRSNGKDLWALEYPIPTFTELNDFSSVPKPQTAAYHGCAQSTRELALLWHI